MDGPSRAQSVAGSCSPSLLTCGHGCALQLLPANGPPPCRHRGGGVRQLTLGHHSPTGWPVVRSNLVRWAGHVTQLQAGGTRSLETSRWRSHLATWRPRTPAMTARCKQPAMQTHASHADRPCPPVGDLGLEHGGLAHQRQAQVRAPAQ